MRAGSSRTVPRRHPFTPAQIMPFFAARLAAWPRPWTMAIALACLTPAVVDAQSVPEIRSTRVLDLHGLPYATQRPVVTTVAMSPDHALLATAGDDHVVRLWNATNSTAVNELVGHRDWVRAAVFSPDGQQLATAGDDHTVRLWNPSQNKQVRTFGDHPLTVYTLAFSSDGNWLAAAGFDRRVSVYDVRRGARARTLDTPSADIRSVAFSPDNSRLAAVGRDGKLRIWQMSDGKLIRQVDAAKQRLRAVSWSPDGNSIATAGEGPEISVWEVATGSPAQIIYARPDQVMSLTFCGPGLLASGGTQNMVRVWDVASGREKARLVGHTGSIAALTVGQDDHSLVSGSFDTTVRWWRITSSGQESTAQQDTIPPHVR